MSFGLVLVLRLTAVVAVRVLTDEGGHEVMALIYFHQFDLAIGLNVVTLNHVLLIAVDEQTTLGAGLETRLVLFKVTTEATGLHRLAIGPFKSLLVFNLGVGGAVRKIGSLIF